MKRLHSCTRCTSRLWAFGSQTKGPDPVRRWPYYICTNGLLVQRIVLHNPSTHASILSCSCTMADLSLWDSRLGILLKLDCIRDFWWKKLRIVLGLGSQWIQPVGNPSQDLVVVVESVEYLTSKFGDMVPFKSKYGANGDYCLTLYSPFPFSAQIHHRHLGAQPWIMSFSATGEGKGETMRLRMLFLCNLTTLEASLCKMYPQSTLLSDLVPLFSI
jgi:hypothetical protein